VFTPTPTPSDTPKGLAAWLADHMRRIAAQLSAPASAVTLDVLHAAPTNARDGMLVQADGTDWNPGGGAGVYARVSGSWVKL
jgi:hypothetical protein